MNWAASVDSASAMVEASPPDDGLGDQVEIAGADLALVAGRGVARGLGGEFGLLQLGIGRHAAVAIAAGQLEHADG